MNGKGILLSVVSAISFGLVPLFSKVAMSYGLDAIGISLMRCIMLLFFSIGMIVYRKVDWRIEKSKYLSIGLATGFQLLTMILLNWSYAYIPTGNATSIHFTYPICVFLLLVFYYKNKFTVTQWVALVLSLIGILFFLDLKNMSNMFGMAIALISGWTYAVYMVILDKHGLAKLDPFVLAGIMCFIQVIVLMILLLFKGGLGISLNWNWLGAVIIASVLAIVGTLLLQIGTRLIGSGMASLFCLFEPLTSLFTGWLFLNDHLSIFHLIGCFLIFSGILLIVHPQKKTYES